MRAIFAFLPLIGTVIGAATCGEDLGSYQDPRYCIRFESSFGVRVNLTDAMINDGAVCLDGSVPVMYFRKGFDDGINKFHIHFEGGGWCAGIDANIGTMTDISENNCVERTKTGFGSSNSYPQYADFSSSYNSVRKEINPLSYNWNTVYVKYCDGTSYSGNNKTVYKYNEETTLHWRGFRILNGVFKELIANYSWSSATDVLITGCSAGALGVWLHSQHIYDEYIVPFGINNFLSMPDSGFFLEWEGNGKYVSMMKWIFEWGNTTASLNKECIAANVGHEWKCMFAQETAPFNNFRMLALQPRFDTWQIGHILLPDAERRDIEVNDYGENLTNAFEEMFIETNDEHFGFLDSCNHHCGSWNAFVIDGMNASQLSVDVYNGNALQNLWFQNELFECEDCCENNIDKGCDDDFTIIKEKTVHFAKSENTQKDGGLMMNHNWSENTHVHLLAFVAISTAFFSFMIGVCIRRLMMDMQTKKIQMRNADK